MGDREWWLDWVRVIHADSSSWWWWCYFLNFFQDIEDSIQFQKPCVSSINLCDNIPNRPSDPHYISFFKPNYSRPVIHLLVSDRVHYTFNNGHTKHNREGGRKEQTNKYGLGLLQAQERESMWHCAFYELTWASNRTKFSQATSHADFFPRWLTRPP